MHTYAYWAFLTPCGELLTSVLQGVAGYCSVLQCVLQGLVAYCYQWPGLIKFTSGTRIVPAIKMINIS